MAGYSGTPLTKKLGLKAGMVARVIRPPKDYDTLLLPMPEGVIWRDDSNRVYDWIHVFVTDSANLVAEFPNWKAWLSKQGCLWVSWPKTKSGMATDLKSAVVRETGLAQGLVDIKVCAVDDTWSGLKFVYRLADR